MRTEQVNLRLDEDILDDLEQVAREEALDRATVIRRLLRESIRRWRLDHAIHGYERGDLSIGRAAEEAGLTQWELLEAIQREGISYPLSGADVRDRLRRAGGNLPGRPPSGSGFRVEEAWMGSTVTTLADIPPRPGGILLIGINPAPTSVAAGHYYQGPLGRRLWGRLTRLGLLADATPGAEDEAFARLGHGLTDLVKRPTSSAAELAGEEVEAGIRLVTRKVEDWRPGLILFAFKAAAMRLLVARGLAAGSGPAFQGVPTFLLSGPYAPGEQARRIDEALLATIADLGLRSGDAPNRVARR